MAKLKAPLLSLGASGAIGKAVVHFNWKGLNVAREYVVPTNPNSAKQQTQRGYLRTLVDFIHACQVMTPKYLKEVDQVAYALLGSTYPTPRTWFNTIIKQGIDQLRLSKGYACYCDADITEVADEIDIDVYCVASLDPTAGDFWYGLTKTALINKKVGAVAAGTWSADITGLITGTKYYIQFRPTAPAGAIGADSGIYTGIPL